MATTRRKAAARGTGRAKPPAPRKPRAAKRPRGAASAPRAIAADVREALAWLERKGTRREREGLARYGITAKKAFGVSVGNIQTLATRCGRSHALALALWRTGWYEARLLACFVDEPARVTPAQMDRWARDFDNWGICDTACFHLFDRTPHAWGRIARWSGAREEFVKRAAFALLACLALHDRACPDAPFTKSLRLIERGAGDERNFVKKGVSWALRSIGRRNAALGAEATALARRLATSEHAATRWVGKDALRDLTKFTTRLASKEQTR
jgi:3-methyladenine DNA glycosylase AlkD